PENSCPIVNGACTPVSGSFLSLGMMIGPATYSCKSLPQIPVQATLIFTCPLFVLGTSFSSTLKSFTSYHTAAFMNDLLLRMYTLYIPFSNYLLNFICKKIIIKVKD